MPTSRVHQRRRATAIVVAALAVLPLLSVALRTTAGAADTGPGDGTTSATAGASCWGIKQQYPSSPTGTYWLNTAALERPQRFHCDMTTAGGGWVLVGRGRQGWTFNPFGQGSPSTVRSPVDGPGAFAPAALDTATVTALLGGTGTDDLVDGIRLERSTNPGGTSRQQFTIFPRHHDWTWNLSAGQLLDRVVIDGTAYAGSNTYDTASSIDGQTVNQLADRQGTARLFTWAWSGHGDQAGFSFGTGVPGGTSAASNHLWTHGSGDRPIPFTRVWIRPRIANDRTGFAPLPTGGFPEATEAPALKHRSEVAPWGVVGIDHVGEMAIEPWRTNVLAIESAAGRTFVGGRFTGVQRGPGATPVPQRSLAAFRPDGTFIESFRPRIDGRVWDLAMTADGRLLVAGDFTSVNGLPSTSGLAALDPATGQVVTTWKASVGATGGRALVRTIDVRGPTVYAAGSFNRITGGTWNTITVSNAISVSTTTGTPGSWRPRLTGQAVDLHVSHDGTRVLLAGYFDRINGNTTHAKFGVTRSSDGAPVAGIGPWATSSGSGSYNYQQAVTDLPDGRMVVGGSQHNIQLWDRDRTRLLDAAVTKRGGDTQTIEVVGDTAYIGCHCGDWVYQGTNDFAAPRGYRSVQPINLIGAWDTTTWEYDTSWYPSSLKGASGEGIWATDVDDRECLWVGGDLNRGAYTGTAATDWLGGFARFCPDDTIAPTPPTALRATTSGDRVSLAWGASTDASGVVAYDVYRGDRVIATVWGHRYTDAEVTGPHRYTVRATDLRGNRSSSPAPIVVNGPAPVIAEVLPFGSTWHHLDTGVEPPSGWQTAGPADQAWPTGRAMLGWGRSEVVTPIGAQRPLTTYYRRSVDIADPGQVRVLGLELRAVQGAVVYVNGVEAGRSNMPAGKVTGSTPASSYLTTAEERAVTSMRIPGSLLRAGTNTIAVEVHNLRAGSGRQSFDLRAVTYGAGGDAVAPSTPSLTATRGPAHVDLAWTPSTDDGDLAGYLVTRDGRPYAVTGPTATSYRDGTVDLGVSHAYRVAAFDANGNVATSGARTITPLADPALLGFGATWRWSYTEGGPGDGWQRADFDDGDWPSGPGELGYGDSDEATRISTSAAPRPLTAYFRTTVTVDDPSAFDTVVADLVRDDGAVLYVNGVEVGRDNLPGGPVVFSTPASTILSDRAVERAPVRFTIPSSAFRRGENLVAVEVHNRDRWSGDLSMDLRLTGQP